ncbi:MAG: transposase, partial [Actinomycetota bacterium]
FQYNPDDITRVYFRDPDTFEWHTLKWEHAGSFNRPISEDQLKFARKRAAAKYRYFDDKLALAELLERQHMGLGATRAERRMALRLSREDALLGSNTEGEATVSMLPSVQKALDQSQPDEESEDYDLLQSNDLPYPQSGDDEDDEEDVDVIEVTEFYADSFEDA